MRYVERRVGFFLVTLWAAITLNFLIPRLMPGNPALAMMSRLKGGVPPSALRALEVAFGVDDHQSLVSSYLSYVANMAQGRFGISLTFFPNTVGHEILQAIPWTVGLLGVTTVLGFVLGTLVGMWSAWRRGSVIDNVLPPVLVIVSAFPYFWVGLIFIWLVSYQLHWLPAGGGYGLADNMSFSLHFMADVLVHATLPGLTILVTAVGGWVLTMRNNMITVLAEDYVRMAVGKGIAPWRVMVGYAGRNAVLPNFTGFAMSLGFVVSGAVLVEYVFNYPGVGWMLLNAVEGEDYPLMQALFLIITVAVLIAVLCADVAAAFLDPRTRERG